jgi:Tc toxin complex TcA C-terminal TcB-binding domain/Neuraminidase-like domain
MSDFFFLPNSASNGPHVAPLHRALILLLERGILLKEDERTRRELLAALKREQKAGAIGDATRRVISIFQEKRKVKISGILDEITAALLNKLFGEIGFIDNDERAFVVRGKVRYADGFPAAGVVVSALDVDLRSQEELGKATTDAGGAYEIHYSTRQFRKLEKGSADLRLRVFSADGSELISSDILFNAPPLAEIDLTIKAEVSQPPSLFEQIKMTVDPVIDGVPVGELEETGENRDLSFLAGETGFDQPLLARYGIAHRLITDFLPAEFWFALLGGSSFEYKSDQSIRDQANRFAKGLISIEATKARKSLTRAFNEHEINDGLRQNTEPWIDAFSSLLAKRAAIGTDDRPTILSSAIKNAGLTGDKGEKFARLMLELETAPAALEAAAKDPAFRKEEVADLHTTFRLADLTGGDFSVVGAIKQEFGVRQPEQIPPLAKRREAEWVGLVETAHKAGRLNLPADVPQSPLRGMSPTEAYGKYLHRQFSDAFPTMAFTGGLERALQNGGARGVQQPDKTVRFFDAYPDFELMNTPVDDFIDRQAPDFQDPAFRSDLKATQRVFKVTQTYEASDVLLADRIHSSQQIYRVGRSEFVRRYQDQPGFTKESAEGTWNRAADTYTASVMLVANLKSWQAEALPAALTGDDDALSKFPNWGNLFKSGDLCECEQCRSVLSPAAYFTDLLMFLHDRKAKNPAQTVKDILFRRRPDLGYIELNCENALTPFPYIDTVCEVLEAAIAKGDDDVELPGFTAIPAANPENAVAAALAGKDVATGPFTLTEVGADPDRWVVHGSEATVLLKKKPPSANFFAEILRNTKAGADELRAYPQYVSVGAYKKLKTAIYPSALPFDLFAEEVRASFQKTNLQRWDLMQTFRSAPNTPAEAEVAAEYFGISVDPSAATDELHLITHAAGTVAEQRGRWGESAANWLDLVGNVKQFLQKTGLEYNDLLVLLDLDFINHDKDISVHHDDPSCDLDKKTIKVLDEKKLDRIHRFLRMWRKLAGWKMWELDLVIHQIGGSSLDETFLTNLFYFSRLRKRLGEKVSVEQACALFGPINTTTHFTKLYEKRADAHYQTLFLNKRLINPPDPSFQLDATGLELPGGQTITSHHVVVQAVLGLGESDLATLAGLTKASDGTAYINDDLKLANLSFLWRHAWLAKLLKLKVNEWKTLLELAGQDIALFADPESAWRFVERIDRVKAAGLTVDALDWILAADRTAKSAMKETDANRFLTALRKELQSIAADYDPAQYDFLMASPPADVAQLSALLTSLLGKLGRDEAAESLFVKTIEGRVVIEAGVLGMPPAFVFPAAITGAPNHIPIEYVDSAKLLRVGGFLSNAQKTVLQSGLIPPAVADLPAYGLALDELVQKSETAADRFVVAEVDVTLAGGVTLPADQPSVPIRYNSATEKLAFIGLMTTAEKAVLIAAGNPGPAIDALFSIPRMAVKFFNPVFTTPLESLPASVDFKVQLSPELSAKISYDAEQRLMRFNGVMTPAEQATLDGLVPNVQPADIAFHAAVNQLASQPQTIVPPDPHVWLTDTDLDATIPANDTVAKRLAGAAKKALAYLSRTLTDNQVIADASVALALTTAMTRKLLDGFAVMAPIVPDPATVTLLAHLTQVFAPATGAIDYASSKTTIDGWYWAARAAALLKQWKLTLPEWELLLTLAPSAQLLDFLTLPLDDTAAMASIDRYLDTSRLLRARDAFPETNLAFLELLDNLNAGKYATRTDFAKDVEGVAETWLQTDVEDLINALDVAYPAGYLLASTWERMRRAFYFIDNLNGHTNTVMQFAAATMQPAEAKAVKELLRSKFGTEGWLTLAAEIQDVLRERKRDALVAYLLTQPKPPDAPSGKWENSNDLYAYYLLDVEMCSCQLTSRLVQSSGSIQLFVQRCFMGLEPDVEVRSDGDDGDSAWRWWTWMRKYRVWEANRKVFLWPENWIEPELKKDRSSFMKDLEQQILQNEINTPNLEAAFTTYLEKLDGVAQLEIAGFFHEDDGDLAIVHVFGRTKGAEPHLYYYRRYDYRQWTPWEKADLDIQGDYLIPAVVAGRLFLFWPVFTEVPDENGNSQMKVPSAGGTPFTPDPAKKFLRMQMAVSDYRQGKWSPKRVSKDAVESAQYAGQIEKKHYTFYPLDRSATDGRFGIRFSGSSSVGSSKDSSVAYLGGTFEIAGCKGVPELADLPGYFRVAIRPETAATGSTTVNAKWNELAARGDAPDNDFALEQAFGSTRNGAVTILRETPWLFSISPPWNLSYMDRLFVDGLAGIGLDHNDIFQVPVGTWLPFFYADKKRTFFALPAFRNWWAGRTSGAPTTPYFYYPEIKKFLRNAEDFFEGFVRTGVEAFDLTTGGAAQRTAVDTFLYQAFPFEAPAPLPDPPPVYTTDEIVAVKELIVRWWMRYVHLLLASVSTLMLPYKQWHFKNFYHPFVCDFAKLVQNPLQGIPAMMSRPTQLKKTSMRFLTTYQPTLWVVDPFVETSYPKEEVDFTPDGAYSPYNWELFFHAPLLIANSLSRDQQFEEARNWYHFIFNPLGVSSPQPGGSPMSKFWITKPFYETTDPQYIAQRIDAILRMLAGDATGPATQARSELEKQALDWRTNPFEPHRIANYRTVAYQKTVVMKYLDNLIAWGDNLFRQDSMESTNEATQLYILAAEILGPRPKSVPPQAKPPLETFNELESQLDKFSNALIQVENVVPPMPGGGPASDDAPPVPTLYFCIPQNEKLLGYWDTIADRLYKLRHCMNIEGVVRQLSLFEPPIDPGALVKAVAGGMDISSALADLNAPLPLYRFTPSLQKANEICSDVKALGSALLAALEKKDAETMALLRQTHELKVLEAVKTLKEMQVDEAKKNLEALQNQKKITETRRNYYRDIQRLTSQERLHIDKLGQSHTLQEAAQGVKLAASIISILPAINLGASGFGGTPHATFKIGGLELGQAAGLAADVLGFLGQIAANDAAMAQSHATYDRRWDDWKFQESLADKELIQIDTQIEAAKQRVTIAAKDVDNQILQIENSIAVDAFMKSKYTNLELFQWQVGQISGVYFQSYRLAYDLAKRAERCFRFELGLRDSSYISFGYWDSLRKGLLSGEKLQYDLRRLESAYMEQNRREFELTKHISLAMFDPLALVKLRETGRCFLRLPEEIFDLDFPGHYFRRIKTVSITLPCVTGPYTSISCTLRLLKNGIRANASLGDGYAHNVDDQGLPADDERFVENNIPVKAIATSNGQNDSGVFELQFRDERYLPFEGAGVISDWSLELFNDLPSNNPDPSDPDFGRPLRQFDYSTISDVLLQVRYTAREDAGPFKNGAVTHLRDYYSLDDTTPSSLILSLRHDFPSQWQRFLNPAVPANGNVFELEVSEALFPYRDRGKTLKVNAISLLARCTDAGTYHVKLAPPLAAGSEKLELAKSTQYGGLHYAKKNSAVTIDPTVPPDVWKLLMKSPANANLVADPPEIDDLFLILGYEWD